MYVWSSIRNKLAWVELVNGLRAIFEENSLEDYAADMRCWSKGCLKLLLLCSLGMYIWFFILNLFHKFPNVSL